MWEIKIKIVDGWLSTSKVNMKNIMNYIEQYKTDQELRELDLFAQLHGVSDWDSLCDCAAGRFFARKNGYGFGSGLPSSKDDGKPEQMAVSQDVSLLKFIDGSVLLQHRTKNDIIYASVLDLAYNSFINQETRDWLLD